MVVHALSPDLRKLIDAIEAWPSTVSQARASAMKVSTGHVDAEMVGAALTDKAAEAAACAEEGAEDGDDDEEDGEEEEGGKKRVVATPVVKLTSSIRAHPSHRLSSMASAVAQRDEVWRHSELGPNIGPGAYPTTTVSMRVYEPAKRSQTFRSTVAPRPRFLGLNGEPNLPDGKYAHSAMPRKPYGAVPGTSPFHSVSYRFDASGYLKSQQTLQAEYRPSRGVHTAPGWDGPHGAAAPAPLYVPHDHAARLAAARASLSRDAGAS